MLKRGNFYSNDRGVWLCLGAMPNHNASFVGMLYVPTNRDDVGLAFEFKDADNSYSDLGDKLNET